MHAIRLLTFLLIASLATPAHAITYRTWQTITGAGALGGALAGVMLYNALAKKDTTIDNEKAEKPEYDEVLIIGKQGTHKIKQRHSKGRSVLAKIGSGVTGAFAGALVLGWWFWSKTPYARHETAQEILRHAQLNPFIMHPVNQANINAVLNPVHAIQEITIQERNLERAQTMCMNALADADEDPNLAGAIGGTQAQVNDLLAQARAHAHAIRNNPAYVAELEAAAQRRRDAEEIRARAERERRANVWRWNWQYADPYPVYPAAYAHPYPAFGPAVIINRPAYQPPVCLAPQNNYHVHVHNPAPAPTVYVQPAPHSTFAPRPPHTPLNPTVAHLLNAHNNQWQAPAGRPTVNAMPIGNAFNPNSGMANFFGRK